MGKATRNQKRLKRRQAKRTAGLGALSPQRVAEMVAHSQSGAAGIHVDQQARRTSAAGHTNRISSRAAVRRAVLKEWS